ncbi:MAG TPA: hypothetical protein VLQ92_13455 [Candidatus Limnocylindrales bacterium]|nr:hypothetical protein [Candidatus Limnocylindrales bacterium]
MATNRSYGALAAATIVVGGVAIALSTLTSGSATPATTTQANFGVGLSAGVRPAQPEDSVPKEVLALPAASQFDKALIGQARQVATQNGRGYWLIPGQSGQLCLIAASGEGDTFESAGTCAPRTQLAKGGIWFSEVDGNGDNQVAILAPDTINQFRTANGRATTVNENFAIVTVPKGTANQWLYVVSSTGDSGSLELGPLSPPAPNS